MANPLGLALHARAHLVMSAMAQMRSAAMSALPPLSGAKRKWLGHRQTGAIDAKRTARDFGL